MPGTIRRAALLFLLILPSFLLSSCEDKGIDVSESDILVFQGKTLGIIGDSISSYRDNSPSSSDTYDGVPYVTYYPNRDVMEEGDIWWGMVASSLGIKFDDVTNCSWSGTKVTGDPTSEKNASVASSWRRIRDLAFRGFEPDIILCYVSCNDWAKNREIGTWSKSDPLPDADHPILTLREAYATMLSRVIQLYPKSTVFCLTNIEDGRRDTVEGAPSENGNGVTVEEWNSNIAEVAEAFGCGVIDLHSCGISYDRIWHYTIDGLHPNKSGMKLIAQKVVDDLILKYKDRTF